MRNPDRQPTFRFKQFEISNCRSAMKVGTDGVLLGAWAFGGIPPEREVRVLDVGCGTGVIALMLAQRFQSAIITGVEINSDAAGEAALNFSASSWGDRLSVTCSDFLEYAVMDGLPGFYDLIISNPPFFTNGALAPDLSRRAARHEGSLDLASLMARASVLLKPGGRLGMVLPAEQQSRMELQAALSGMTLVRICFVKTVDRKAPRRILCELVKGTTDMLTGADAGSTTSHMQPEHLTLQLSNGDFSDEYRKLVSPFYIKL